VFSPRFRARRDQRLKVTEMIIDFKSTFVMLLPKIEHGRAKDGVKRSEKQRQMLEKSPDDLGCVRVAQPLQIK
jgi:hypothetical protein